jgi:peptide/nickel transport system permease protein
MMLLTNNQSFLAGMFKKKKLAFFSLIILALFLLVAILADLIAPTRMENGQLPTNLLHKLKAPSLEHPLGTDTLGHDMLSYMIYGARTSVVLSIVCTILSTIISIIIGASSAVISGKFDLILQRFVDAWMCIPGMLIMLILMSILGSGIIQLIIVISIPSGIRCSRMVRSAAMAVKDSGYSKMSKILGDGTFWRMRKHIIPNILPILLMNMATSIGGVVMMEASLNFLGFGVKIGTPSWGAMLTNQGRAAMYSAPWLALAPGIAIALMVFASAMLGDGLRDLLDPRLKGGVGTYSYKKIRKIAMRYTNETGIT